MPFPMRNIFDQYSQPENRLTHALVCVLDADRTLLRPFARWAGARETPPASRLTITEQQVPGQPVSGDEDDGRGLPDACIFDGQSWSLLIESKISAGISVPQLRRHIATAHRHDFKKPHLLLLAIDAPPAKLPKGVTHRSWRELYVWFRKRAAESEWAAILTEYMERFESSMIAQNYAIRGTLTMFDGLRFDEDNPYTYREGKRLIRLLGDELQNRGDLKRLGIDPNGSRRSAITGGSESAGVWDFLPLRCARGASNFTAYPHLTMSINRDFAAASITIPNGVKGGFRTKLKTDGEDGFRELLRDIESKLRHLSRRSTGANVHASALQRHYRSQRSVGSVNARLDADLRTIVPGKRREAKHQPEWISAIYHVLTNKRSNIQFGLSARFQHDCPVIRSAKASELFAEAWVGMKPLLDFVLQE